MRESTAQTRFIAGALNVEPTGVRGPTTPGSLPQPTVPVDSPTRAETQQAFAEVSSALRGISSQHEEVRSGMQELASGVEALRCARASDVETTAQVQATLQ